jgi:signal transduction histidine kinase
MQRVARYAVALAVVALALALKIPFSDLGTNHPFLLLPAAVVLATWYGGRGPGLVATIVAAVGADVLFLPPFGLGMDPGEFVALGALIAEGLLIVVVTDELRAARVRAQHEATEADRARRSASLALQMREELLRLWSQKLAGPLAHIVVATQSARDAMRSGNGDRAVASLDALANDVGLLQRTADQLIEKAPNPPAP